MLWSSKVEVNLYKWGLPSIQYKQLKGEAQPITYSMLELFLKDNNINHQMEEECD